MMTGPERRIVLRLIDEGARDRLEGRRECCRCRRDLPREEFPAARSWCRTCEATRVREARTRRKVTALEPGALLTADRRRR
jgi:hypothetical protein